MNATFHLLLQANTNIIAQILADEAIESDTQHSALGVALDGIRLSVFSYLILMAIPCGSYSKQPRSIKPERIRWFPARSTARNVELGK